MDNHLGAAIMKKRKLLGYTQQNIAEYLNVSSQSVSKWETGASCPDITLLPQIACILETTTDSLLGYRPLPTTAYEEHYRKKEYYWGLNPNPLCYEIMKIMPPTKPRRVLDIGCGEGKDAVFLARNGYIVSAFDAAETGLEKARTLADANRVHIDFFRADILDYKSDACFDIIFSSGVFHYIPPHFRKECISYLKKHTSPGGIHAVNVFVEKPFLAPAPDLERTEAENPGWYSGELFMLYHDWLFHKMEEEIFDCNSGGVSHRHCMNLLIAEKINE